MKHIKVLTILLFAVYISPHNLAAQNNLKQADIASQVETTAQQKEISELKSQLADLKKEIEVLDKQYGVKETDIKDYIQQKYLKWWIPISTAIGTIISLIGGLIGYSTIKKNLLLKIDKKVMDELDKYLKSSEWTNALKVKINKQLDQNKLKAKMKICVLSNGNIEDMSLFLKGNEFSNVDYHTFSGNIKNDSNILKNEFQILIVNNQSNQFGFKSIKLDSGAYVPDKNTPINDLIDLIKKKYPTLAVFYYNDSGDNLPRELNTGLISSFTNSYASFYHNVLDLMRYKHIVIDHKPL